jgi:hypothetical protein
MFSSELLFKSNIIQQAPLMGFAPLRRIRQCEFTNAGLPPPTSVPSMSILTTSTTYTSLNPSKESPW